MIYCTLPNFLEKRKINTFLLNYAKKNLIKLKYPIHFTTLSGCFPWSIWNGSLNSNYGNGVKYLDIINNLKNIDFHIRLDCSNLLIEDNDFFNVFQNLILENIKDKNVQIELSNFKLLTYIKNLYPNFRFVISEKADLLNRFTPTLINTLTKISEIDLIKLPIRFNKDKDFLKQIDNPLKIEIIINPVCNIKCDKYESCIVAENNAQINFSELSCFKMCSKVLPKIEMLNRYLTFNDIYNLKQEYNINHFSFQETSYFYNDIDLLNFFINYFFKPEYQMEVFNTWINIGGNL